MVDPTVIVLVCIFGSGVGVLMAYAIAHRFYSSNPSSSVGKDLEGNERGSSQAAYMREVRIRNYEGIAAVTGMRGKGRVNVESMSDRSG